MKIRDTFCLSALVEKSLGGFGNKFLPHADFRPVAFEGDVVHKRLHQKNPSSVVRGQIVGRQRIRDAVELKSLSVIPHYHRHGLAPFTTAANLDQLASIGPIAVQDCVAQGFAKREFDRKCLSLNAISQQLY